MIEQEFNSALASLTDGPVSEARYLLGVSGGIDSICMAELFLRSHFHPHFAVAHVNFSLRGKDSIADMESVRQWAGRNDIPFYSVIYDAKLYASEHSVSTQMAARDLRYSWFRKLMEEEGFEYLAIAHNLDDSIETIFLNLLRGTGVRGLSGIQQRNGRIIRPLLSVPRKEIAQYVAEHSISYRDDVTNFESHYSRNRIRNIIFPEFKKINPSFLNTIERDSGYFSQAMDILDGLFEEKKQHYCKMEAGRLVISSDLLKGEPQGGYWLYRILKEYGFNSAQLVELERCLRESQTGKSFMSETHEVVVDRGALNLYAKEQDEAQFSECVITAPGIYSFAGRSFKFDIYVRKKGFRPRPAAGELFFAMDQIALPLVCRAWKSGDRFRPFGMKSGAKKLSDLFTDLKFDKYQKAHQAVLTDNEGHIVCLPGIRIDDRYKIKTSTSIIAEVTYLD